MVTSTRSTKNVIPFHASAPPAISVKDSIKAFEYTFLRIFSASSGLSIRPKTKLNKIEQLKLMIEAGGMNPNEIRSNQALTIPHRTIVDPEQSDINALNQALKHAILEELHSESKKDI
jgi:hypothetical protein